MSDETNDSAFHLAREKETSKALLHALAVAGEKIRELARERDGARNWGNQIAAEMTLARQSLHEEQRQHEETKQKSESFRVRLEMQLQKQTNEARLKRSRRK
jgi:hypothetical protein